MASALVRTQADGWLLSDLPDAVPATMQRTFMSPLPSVAGAVTIEDTAYFVYLFKAPRDITLNWIRFTVGVGGTGAQTAAEVAFCSSPLAPNGASQVLTKIAHNATLSDLTQTGTMKNTVAMATLIPAGTHLWAALRTAMATNEPSCLGVCGDAGTGQILRTTTAGALSAAGPWTGALITDTGAWLGPRLVASID
jgi:hypothetical protein